MLENSEGYLPSLAMEVSRAVRMYRAGYVLRGSKWKQICSFFPYTAVNKSLQWGDSRPLQHATITDGKFNYGYSKSRSEVCFQLEISYKAPAPSVFSTCSCAFPTACWTSLPCEHCPTETHKHSHLKQHMSCIRQHGTAYVCSFPITKAFYASQSLPEIVWQIAERKSKLWDENLL